MTDLADGWGIAAGKATILTQTAFAGDILTGLGHNKAMDSRLQSHLASRLVCHFLIVGLLVCARAGASEVDNSKEYVDQIKPILAAHCFRCHGEKTQKADFRLDHFRGDLKSDRREAERWHDILAVLRQGEMPPPEDKQLSKQDFAILTRWIDRKLTQHAKADKANGGRVVLRRLNRVEYQNTMRDLMGIDTNYIQDLPPEGLSDQGFRNDGQTLQMSDLQLESFLRAARTGLQKAIVSGSEPEVIEQTFKESINDKNRGSRYLDDDQQFIARLTEYPEEGEFVVRVRARARLVDGRGDPVLRVAVGYRADVQAPRRFIKTVDVNDDQWQTIEFRARIEDFPLPSKTQSKFPGLLIWVDNAYAEGAIKPLKPKRPIKKKRQKKNQPEFDPPPAPTLPTNYPVIEVDSVQFVGPVFSSWPPRHHRAILPERDDTPERQFVSERVLKPFMERAFRRPVRSAEVDPFARYYEIARGSTDSFEDAIRETLAMVLVSPDFLYLIEPAKDKQKRRLNSHELASRLSYFLWSTMPDQALLNAAANGELSQPANLLRQVDRMLERCAFGPVH